MNDDIKNFTDWDTYYKDNKVEEMPWYSKELDEDLKKELERKEITKGSILDIGTGSGTQAVQLADMGFEVTAMDISPIAIENAGKLSKKVEFVQDDILNTKITKKFDYIFDRGCFHILETGDRIKYVKAVKKLLNDNGTIFLKVFSSKQKGNLGPSRFTPEKLWTIFGKEFEVLQVRSTVYQGTEAEDPFALFAVLKKR